MRHGATSCSCLPMMSCLRGLASCARAARPSALARSRSRVLALEPLPCVPSCPRARGSAALAVVCLALVSCAHVSLLLSSPGSRPPLSAARLCYPAFVPSLFAGPLRPLLQGFLCFRLLPSVSRLDFRASFSGFCLPVLFSEFIFRVFVSGFSFPEIFRPDFSVFIFLNNFSGLFFPGLFFDL